MISIIVNGQSLSGECKRLASDSVDYIRCRFSFSSDWYGLIKTAQFTQNGKTFDVLVENDICTLPSEIVAGDLEISVFGVESGGTKRITTVPFTASIKASGFVSEGEVPIPPTPDLYSQLIKRVEDAVDNMPDSLSHFTNDMGFITDEAVPKKLSQLENDSGFVTDESVPKMVSELENDSGFITDESVPKLVSELENDTLFVTEEAIPTKLSQLENDTDFATNEYVAGLVGDIDEALDGIISMQNELISMGEISADELPGVSGGDAL